MNDFLKKLAADLQPSVDRFNEAREAAKKREEATAENFETLRDEWLKNADDPDARKAAIDDALSQIEAALIGGELLRLQDPARSLRNLVQSATPSHFAQFVRV